ncbi:ABC transporter permease, partial [Thermobifida cellulosilytica]
MTATVRGTRGAPLAAATAAETYKLWTLRAHRAAVLAAPAVSAAVAVLLCATVGATTGSSMAEHSAFDMVATSLLGVDAASVVLLTVGAATVGVEYSTGMVRTTLTALPARGRFLAARTAAVGSAALGAGLLSAAAGFAAGQLVLAAAGLPTVSPLEPQVLRALGGTALTAPFLALAAVFLAVVLRSTTGGVVGALVLLALPAPVRWGPESWQGVVLGVLPTEALHSLAGLTAQDAPFHLPAAAAAAV